MEQMSIKSETDRLFTLIRSMGITVIASFAGMTAGQILTHGQCELCKKSFNSAHPLARLENPLSELDAWRQ